jgi:hypothetical protein
LTDPRTSIKTLLAAQITDANLTRDDDATELSWISVFGPYEEHLTRVFFDKSVDLIFVIDDAVRVTTTLGVSHVGEYPVTPYAIDKYDSSGTRIITATLVLWKATEELRRVFLENPWGSLRTLTEDRAEPHDFGGTKVWSKPCLIEYKTYST